MILSRNLMLALTVTGSAALALLAVKRRARLVETTAEHKKALQRWEDDTGNVLPDKPIKHPSY
jgi:hypothetical protein